MTTIVEERILNHPSLSLSANSSFIPKLLYPNSYHAMGNKGRATPRVVCCAIPISKAAGKVLVVTSRKRQDRWVCESFPSRLVTWPLLMQTTFFLPIFSFGACDSAERWLGSVRCAAGGCCLA